jgi:hypothetical protein
MNHHIKIELHHNTKKKKIRGKNPCPQNYLKPGNIGTRMCVVAFLMWENPSEEDFPSLTLIPVLKQTYLVHALLFPFFKVI